jgi:hypothetical protein
MRFPYLLGMAMCVATPLAGAEVVPPPRHLQAIPLVRDLADMFCPTQHRLEVVVASLRRAGWRRAGAQQPGHVVQGQPTLRTPWARHGQIIWVRHNNIVCVMP